MSQQLQLEPYVNDIKATGFGFVLQRFIYKKKQ